MNTATVYTITNKEAKEAIQLTNAIESWSDVDTTIEDFADEMIITLLNKVEDANYTPNNQEN